MVFESGLTKCAGRRLAPDSEEPGVEAGEALAISPRKAQASPTSPINCAQSTFTMPSCRHLSPDGKPRRWWRRWPVGLGSDRARGSASQSVECQVGYVADYE